MSERRQLRKEARVQLYTEDFAFLANDVAEHGDILEHSFEVAKGDKGDQGDKGEPGQSIVGPAGKNGRDGKDGQNIVGPAGRDGKDGESFVGLPGKDGNDGSPDTAEQIREKLHTLTEAERLDAKAIKGLLTAEDVVKHIKGLKGKQRLGKEHLNMPESQPLDQRWHGAGLQNSNFIDNELVSGSGTSWVLKKIPQLNSEHLFVNGQRISTVTGDYTILGKFITTTLSWVTGTMVADYRIQ